MAKERDRDQQRKREKAAGNKNIFVPDCADRDRRELLESDDIEWLLWYYAPESGCSDPFTYMFTGQQQEMIAAIRCAITEGGDQSIAASRGEGKTTLFERMLTKYTLQGRIHFSVLFAATGGAAEDSLDSIKLGLEENLHLAMDYPEVCTPVAALENTPNRAHYQTVSGRRHDTGEPYDRVASKFSWCGQTIILPNVPGSPSAGSIIATRGLDSAVRGLKKKGKRVDVAGIDDPDTEETANSEEQANKLEKRIDRAIAGLGGQTRRVARVMLTTLQNRTCVSYRFTDPKQKQSWRGRRFRFLVKPPDRADLWDEYVALLKVDWQNEEQGNPTELAMEFYMENFDAMNAGAQVANPNRHTERELSALQFYYNEVARIGPDAVATEYDNDPPEATGPVDSGITSGRLQRQVSGFPRGTVPPDVVMITAGIDIGKWWLHWVIVAWTADGTGYVIDYGAHKTAGATFGSDQGLDLVVHRAVLQLLEQFRALPYTIGLVLVDASYRTDGVYSACAEAGLGIYPIMGFGKSEGGATRTTFRPEKHIAPDKRPGDGWWLHKLGKIWLCGADADRWKAWVHDRIMTAPDKPGCLYLFGEPGEQGGAMSADERSHGDFALQATAEVETEEVVKGVLRRTWKKIRKDNHWLDGLYYAAVAANVKGIRLPIAATAKTTAPDRLPGQQAAGAISAPVSIADLARRAQARGG